MGWVVSIGKSARGVCVCECVLITSRRCNITFDGFAEDVCVHVACVCVCVMRVYIRGGISNG